MEIAYYVAVSLDGYIATPDGGVDWLAPFEGDEDYGYAAFYRGLDAVVMGRGTYAKCLQFDAWPYPDKPAWVFVRGETTAPPSGVTFTAESPAAWAGRQTDAGRLWLVGGGRLAGAFQAAGLIDEYIVSVMPVLLGGGIPLLAPPGRCEGLVLTQTRVYPRGVVQLHYRRNAEPQETA